MKNIFIQRVLILSISLMVFLAVSISIVDKNLSIRCMEFKLKQKDREIFNLHQKLDSIKNVDSLNIIELQKQYNKVYLLNKEVMRLKGREVPKYLKRKMILISEN